MRSRLIEHARPESCRTAPHRERPQGGRAAARTPSPTACRWACGGSSRAWRQARGDLSAPMTRTCYDRSSRVSARCRRPDRREQRRPRSLAFVSESPGSLSKIAPALARNAASRARAQSAGDEWLAPGIVGPEISKRAEQDRVRPEQIELPEVAERALACSSRVLAEDVVDERGSLVRVSVGVSRDGVRAAAATLERRSCGSCWRRHCDSPRRSQRLLYLP